MRRPVVLILTAAALATGAGASAARAEDAARELTLDQALDMARKANRSLIVERARLSQAQTNIEQAWAALFPVVTTQGKYTHNYKQATLMLPGGAPPVTILKQEQLDASINATMPLLAPAAYPALEAVKTNVLSSEANLEASEAAVLFSVAQSFYAAATGDEVLVARRSNIEVARATLKNAQARFSAGTVTKVDVDRAELALVRTEQAEREARYGWEQAYRGLGTLIQAQGPFRVRTSPAAPAAVPPADVDAALHLRPEFRALELAAKAADAQRRAYGWRWAPQLSAFGNARIGNYQGFTGDKYSWAVGAQLDWTLYDGGVRDAQRHLAAAQGAEAAARAEVLRDSIRDDLANTRSQLDTKTQGQKAAERQVALAHETLDLVRTQYEAGTATQVDLLQAQDSVVAAQEALAQAHFDVAVADLTLRRTAGTFPAK